MLHSRSTNITKVYKQVIKKMPKQKKLLRHFLVDYRMFNKLRFYFLFLND